MRIDFGRLTQEETLEIAREAMSYLDNNTLIEWLTVWLDGDVREELIARWTSEGFYTEED